MTTTIQETPGMCRNIKPLFNLDPPTTDDEVEAAARQFVRKISGFNRPSRVNEPVFDAAIQDIAAIARRFLSELESSAEPRDREVEAERARARSARRFG